MLKVVLAVEIVVLSGRYFKEHTSAQVYEREITGNAVEEKVFGVGIDIENGGMFWFHRETDVD